jgi:chromatin segregation and condensation protein Rec8/ScpA/Scc1 (kleisin family)
LYIIEKYENAKKIAKEKFSRKPKRVREDVDSMIIFKNKKKKQPSNSKESVTDDKLAPYMKNILKDLENSKVNYFILYFGFGKHNLNF